MLDRFLLSRQLATCAALVSLVLATPLASSRAVAEVSDGLTEVGTLIEQLGADSYATRIRAKERLQRMGLEAFDELHLAQYHPDNEIAMAARFLVSSLAISWSKETDPPEVRDTLVEYGAQDESERSSRIDRLAEFPSRRGLTALVRLVRFETSLRLSRRAALALMRQSNSNERTTQAVNAERIVQGLGDNQRQAAQWLRVYAEDLAAGEYSADRWRQLIQAQREQIDTASTQQSSRPSVLELVRISATRAAAAGQTEEALRLATENSDLIAPKTRQLVDASSWAIDNDLHPFVLVLKGQHERMFNRHSLLLYSAAEAMKIAGDPEQAEALAQQAAAIKPLPKTEAEKAALSPKEIEETAQLHREIGLKLEERGLFHWAEREFRQIIESMELDAQPSATARSDLSRMLGELNRHDDVVEVLKPLTDRIEKDNKLRQQLNSRFMFQYNRVRSDLDYHAALALIKQGKTDEAKPLLVKAFRLYPPNIDILIQMHRVEGDDEWNTMVQTMLERTVRQVDSDIQQARAQARQLGAIGNETLGHELNQYAWLVSNTEGDYQKALNYSLQSLELDEDAAKLDTCARCYFALGDLDNAILMQKRALRMMPHSPPMRRQLGQFQAARSKADSSSQP